MTSDDLPEPLTPVTAMNAPSGNLDVHVFEVVLPGADVEDVPTGRFVDFAESVESARRFVGTGIASLPRRYCPVSEFSFFRTCFGVSAGRDLAAAVAGAGAEVEQVVGGGDHFAIVFDQDQRVAEVAQLFQRLQEPLVVARVKPDRRLVEDVEHAGQAAADLAGEADALRFAAGECRAGAAEREVIEADIDEELQPVRDLADDFAGDLLFAFESFKVLNCASVSPSGRAAVRRADAREARARRHRAEYAQPRQAEQGTSSTRWSRRWR